MDGWMDVYQLTTFCLTAATETFAKELASPKYFPTDSEELRDY